MLYDKFNIEYTESDISKEIHRLTNQLWKLIPMKENGEDWQKQLNTVIVEIAGLNQLFFENTHFLQLLSKLEGIKALEDIEFELYRRTIFESISLLQGFLKNNE